MLRTAAKRTSIECDGHKTESLMVDHDIARSGQKWKPSLFSLDLISGGSCVQINYFKPRAFDAKLQINKLITEP